MLAAQYGSWSLPLSVILIAPICLLAATVAVFFGMLGVTLFGLLFTPIFYMAVRDLADRRPAKQTEAVAA